MSTTDYDVVVVGGGPAGSSAAYHLATSGLNVLLTEKAKSPREKVCGECIMPRAVVEMRAMGLEDRCKDFYRIAGFRVGYKEHRPVELEMPSIPPYPNCMYTVRRPVFDQILLERAREAGAEVREECKVTGPLEEDGRVSGVRAIQDGKPVEFSAKVVVGADGGHSILAKSLGLLINDEAALGYSVRQLFEGVEGLDNHINVYVKEEIKLGYAWIFPLTSTLANVGIGTSLKDIRESHMDLADLLSILTNNTSLAPMFKNATPASPLRGSLLRSGLACSGIEYPGLILVGDAASMVCPSSGEGISYAMETGRMAAEHLLESKRGGYGLQHDPAMHSFKKKLEARYGRYFSTMQWSASHLLDKSFFWMTFLALSRSSFYRRRYVITTTNLRKK